MSVNERTLSDGTVVYDARRFMGYTADGKPDRRSVTCRTRRAAELEDAKMLAERDAMRGRSGRMTLSAYVERHYWPAACTRLAATSKDTYRREIDKRILPALGGMDIRNIDRQSIQKMVDGIETLDPARKCVGVLKTILNEAQGDGLILSNPARANFAMPPKGRKRDNGVVIGRFQDMSALLDAVFDDGDESLQKLAVTGLLMGLRPEERYGLDWEDLDLDAGIANVRQAYVTASPQHGGKQVKPTKTELSTRRLPIPAPAVERLRGIPRADGPFILGTNGKRISPATAQHRWAAFLAAHPELPQVTLENMRHSFATSYLHAGGNVEDLSRMLGHSDINTTFRKYVKPDVDSLRRGMDAFVRM